MTWTTADILYGPEIDGLRADAVNSGELRIVPVSPCVGAYQACRLA